jgi:hypothetical protein
MGGGARAGDGGDGHVLPHQKRYDSEERGLHQLAAACELALVESRQDADGPVAAAQMSVIEEPARKGRPGRLSCRPGPHHLDHLVQGGTFSYGPHEPLSEQ